MTSLLCKLFIKNKDDTASPLVRRAYGTLVSIVGILLNLLLAGGKLTAGILTGSLSIQADAINNLSDAGSQIISLVTFRMAAKPADRDHPFGHARIEYVASMAVSFLILLIGWELFSSSLDKALHPTSTLFSWLSVGILGVSVLVKLWLFFFNRKIARKIDSSVMRATAADSLSDAGATLAVLVSTLIYKFTSLDIDAYMGMLVAILILVAGIKILNETKNSILGEKPADETIEQISEVVGRYPDALGIHDLIVHNYGPGRVIVSLHVEVDGHEDIFKSHDMADCIERDLRTEFGMEATVHMDPIVLNDPLVDELRKLTIAAVQTLYPTVKIHDFRIVPGDTHTNLIFDIAVPFEIEDSDETICAQINSQIKARKADCFAVITVDRV